MASTASSLRSAYRPEPFAVTLAVGGPDGGALKGDPFSSTAAIASSANAGTSAGTHGLRPCD